MTTSEVQANLGASGGLVLNRSNLAVPTMGSVLLHASAGLTCRLGFYREGSAQREHRHPVPTVSLVLSGTIHERIRGREVTARPRSISIKAPDVPHSDVYGRNGALVLSVVLDEGHIIERGRPGA